MTASSPNPSPHLPQLEHTYVQACPSLAHPAQPEIPAGSKVAWVNHSLARQLGLDSERLASAQGLTWLTGGASKSTYALAYSGYQFGQLSPVLGDGRAHLTGELTPSPKAGDTPGARAHRLDLHLKGSGRTPFSRPGSDGKAPLSAIWREAVIGEFLHAMNVPTSRVLAIIETGERIRRRSPQPEPAGIGVRVANSHIRVGTFQYAQYRADTDIRRELVSYALHRHYPEVELPATSGQEALALLRAVAQRQAELVAQWQALGFVHGVLNTDNVTISGQAIDFGPCALIDTFRRGAVYSSIDQNGRYAYDQQPAVTQWNLARFAETLLDLIDGENPNRAIHLATEVLAEFEETIRDRQVSLFAQKIGCDLSSTPVEHRVQVAAFIDRTLGLLEEQSLDFTGFFSSLTGGSCLLKGQEQAAWLAEQQHLQELTQTTPERTEQLMKRANPLYIPRNLALETALRQVERGNLEPVLGLIDIISRPFTPQEGAEFLQTAPAQSRFFVSFCGT
ncbi:protein adenylyltransferase SelO family protein [Rothia sp. P4278]|uniref:protein adenylyltransferase SelO family protein n=1 Tax=Rothia sp. P4278 TaxID=3402658 RepID=UPI003AE3758A